MELQKAQNIFMTGIKGVGMTALALILQKMGKNVWGSDVFEKFKTDEVLKRNGIKAVLGFNEQNISNNIDLVITTAAHGGLGNPEVIAARDRGIKVLTHAEALGSVMNLFKTKIAVCGSHGKTTVSALAAFVFLKLGEKIGYHVGAATFSGYDGGGFTGFDYFITEADEYVSSPGIDKTPRFLYQNPNIVISTNIDFDHPDVYANIDEVEDVFERFLQKLTEKDGVLIYYKNDALLEKIARELPFKKAIGYDWADTVDLTLSIPGRHNLINAAAVLALFKNLGRDEKKIRNILSDFRGSSRRFEKIYEDFAFVLYDDYAHHPVEIVATIEAFKAQFPSRRLIVIFQPHTFSRTEKLKQGFIQALAKADVSLVVDIFPSKRENPDDYTITSYSLVFDAQQQSLKNIIYCPIRNLENTLSTVLKTGDVIVTMGAGSIYRSHSDIISLIKKR